MISVVHQRRGRPADVKFSHPIEMIRMRMRHKNISNIREFDGMSQTLRAEIRIGVNKNALISFFYKKTKACARSFGIWVAAGRAFASGQGSARGISRAKNGDFHKNLVRRGNSSERVHLLARFTREIYFIYCW